MKKIMRKAISILLVFAILVSIMPLSIFAAGPAQTGTYTLKNNAIEAVVSLENGGFIIRTVDGDKLKKDDSNKNLLYHSSLYDTSFTSFQVDYGNNDVREYIFGGKYGFLGLASSDVAVTRDTTGITATWSVDDLTFIQRIELSALYSNEHGMASIGYSVKNNGSSTISGVKVRILLDSCLGNRDYAYYNIPVDSVGTLDMVQTEKVYDYAPGDFVPATLYANDDAMMPSTTAYTVNSTLPYRIAFGHWNNLASTLFEFTPDPALEFTNPFNDTYLTADSAYALYYDLKDVAPGGEKSLSTYYGVYSNVSSSAEDGVAINITSPTTLNLSADKQSYLPSDLALGSANIGVDVKINNFAKDITTDYGKVAVAIYTPNGITPMDEGGNTLGGNYSVTDPYRILLTDFTSKQIRTTTFQLKADVGSTASYRKIEIRAFDVSGQELLTEQNLLGSASFYVLCPGGDGELPKITFTGGEPDILYYEGTRHFFVTGNNFTMLEDKSRYKLYIESLTDPNVSHLIEPDHITFPKNPEGNILNAIITHPLPVGDYQLVFHWEDIAVTDGIVDQKDKVMTAPALKVTMSDNPAYKNDTYGVMIVYQEPGTSSNNSSYEIKSFQSETQFQTFQSNTANYEEILIILRGAFEVDTKDGLGNPVSWTATVGKAALVNGMVNQNTIVSLNNCIDFENGTLALHYAGNDKSSGKIEVDFDGDLYTSVERSSIWKGKAALTAIENGTDYSLVPYNEDGAVDPLFTDETITLVWPSALGLAQTLGGMVFNMTYGQLGVMLDKTDPSNPVELGRVLSFSANMDLSFLVPAGAATDGADTKWNRIQDAFSLDSDYWTLRDRYERFVEEPSEEDQKKIEEGAGQASVMVDNILFGSGAGFIGFQTEVSVSLPAYTASMPSMSCDLKINTIGDWSFGVKGTSKFTTIEVEVEFEFKSNNNIPVPDKLYFFISGFEPGINVDGSGVLWITGGGGGIDKLYDTIFAGDKIPPLKILLSVNFDIIKALSARVDMSIGLRGLSLSANSITIKFTDIMALERAGLQFDWYPDWYFLASVRVDLLDIIKGSGYIVVIDNAQYDKFFEFFVRAGITIPSYIPIVGGIEAGGVDLGINTERLWGVARIIGINFGMVYYWDGDFDWGAGAGDTSPTFPGLLGYESVPVYYDEETGQTLRMIIGTNLSVLARPGALEGYGIQPMLLSIDPALFSSADKRTHKLNLGTYSPSGRIFTITYDAVGLADAEAKAAAMIIKDAGAADYGIIPGIEGNANITYDPQKGKGTLAVSATQASQFSKTWDINTVIPADIVVYEVAAIPEITAVSQSISGNSATVTWTGTDTHKLDRLDFYLTTDPGTGAEITDMGVLIGSLDNSGINAAGGTSVFSLPGTLQTGNYYIKAVYTREGTVNGSKTSGQTILYENANQPAAPVGITVTNAGDSAFNVSAGNNDNTDYDAYVLNVYEYDQGIGTWVLSDVNSIFYKKERVVDNGNVIMLPISNMSVGGAYSGFDQNGNPAEYGLSPGESYRIGVTAVKEITDASDNYLYSVASTETLSQEITLAVPTPPVVTIGNVSPFIPVDRSEWGEGGTQVTRTYDTSKTAYVAFNIHSDVPVTGHWDINGDYRNNVNTAASGLSGSFTDTVSFDINLSGFPDGDHTLAVWGTDEDGDSFRVQKVFAVDTQPPKLLITTPVNGGYFAESGVLNISGVTDRNALFTIVFDGNSPAAGYSDKTIAQLGGTIDADGVFSFNVLLDPEKSSHRVLILAKDEVGNFMRHEVMVKNDGLANIENLDIYMSDGSSSPVLYSNLNLPVSRRSETTAVFSLVANTKNNSRIIIDDDSSLVDWNALAVEGSVSIDDNGVLTASADSLGFVTGGLKVAARGSMTASATFGAERYAGTYSVTMDSTGEGVVTGDGYYLPGDTVNISAVPYPGYRFSGWVVNGAVLAGNTASTTFVMPSNDVTVTAVFARVSGSDDSSDSGNDSKIIESPSSRIIENSSTSAKAGDISSIAIPDIPEGVSPNVYVPVYSDAEGNNVTVPFSVVQDGKLIFIAPEDSTYFIQQSGGEFIDIEGHWAREPILFAMARGIFKGVGGGKFDPEGTMDRAMLVTVLYRLAGKPEAGECAFMDVPEETWYTNAVAWASQNGIVAGYNSKEFGPLDQMTREQFAVVLYRFMQTLGKNTNANSGLSTFSDSDDVSPWAQEAMEWAVGTGIIMGMTGGTLKPGNNATRSESCTMLIRFIRLVVLGEV